jgi:hypothetical protein
LAFPVASTIWSSVSRRSSGVAPNKREKSMFSLHSPRLTILSVQRKAAVQEGG